MICAADTMGVFQIESRAQMSMLPRLRPRCYYDLVVEVAIVRPGPIQGNMVHPYLRRRAGKEAVTYPHPTVQQVLEKTLGVPIFQEQAMRLAVVAAGFTSGEADQLRRAMAAWRRPGTIMEKFRDKLIQGMLANGIRREFAEQVFHQIQGFGEYGFPESHAASFALLVYVSAWLKHYYPAAFAAALVNSQPMGFYAPAQLVRNAREHGVEIRPVDVNASCWDCTLETSPPGAPGTPGQGGGEGAFLPPCGAPGGYPLVGAGQGGLGGVPLPALRLGLRLVLGLSEKHAAAIEHARQHGEFYSVDDFARRTKLPQAVISKLAAADAFASLQLNRRQALWQALATERGSGSRFRSPPGTKSLIGRGPAEEIPSEDVLSTQYSVLDAGPVSADQHTHPSSLFAHLPAEPDDQTALPPMPEFEEVRADYAATGLSLRRHPIGFVRMELDALGVAPAEKLAVLPNNSHVRVAGLVLMRQRPSTAKGITFVTLEDETATANLIVHIQTWRKYYRVARTAAALLAHGTLQREGPVIHVIVSRLEDLTAKLNAVKPKSRDFR